MVVHVGDSPSVGAEGDALAVERLDVRIEDGTLRSHRGIGSTSELRPRRHGLCRAPTLEGAYLSGSGPMGWIGSSPEPLRQRCGAPAVCRSRRQAHSAQSPCPAQAACGSMRCAERFDAALSGSGSLRASGTAETSRSARKGFGERQSRPAADAPTTVAASGSGNLAVHASEAAEGSLQGSGNVTVHGPAHCSITKSGSGHIRCGA